MPKTYELRDLPPALWAALQARARAAGMPVHGIIIAALLAPPAPPEVCLCAAYLLDDGRIIRGHRHDDCFQTALKWKAAGQTVGSLTQADRQGFLTSQGRFVGREEAYALQDAAGLIPASKRGIALLTSEDLY